MKNRLSRRLQQPRSSDTGTNNSSSDFIETLEYRRFVEFCDACRRYRYVGLCYGTPGIGKTLSAIRCSRTQAMLEAVAAPEMSPDGQPIDTVLYTPSVVNCPSGVANELRLARTRVDNIAKRAFQREMREALDAIRIRDEAALNDRRFKTKCNWEGSSKRRPTYMEVRERYREREKSLKPATTLILVDEADRLRMASLEQIRDIFDEGTIGLILIGMPGVEKRMARYPQFYSRIGFVHEFRALAVTEMRELLGRRWVPQGVTLPESGLGPEAVAAVLRMTGGNFRLLNRLLTQIKRILEVNGLEKIDLAVVQAARESLVIGQA